MSVAVIGAGAIGGLLAAELAGAGEPVTLCSRSPLERLVVERPGGVSELALGDGLASVTDPAAVTPVDWVVVALKTQDSPAAGPWLERLAEPGSVVVAAQNGIEHEQRVGPLCGPAELLPALVYAAVERVGPGRLLHRTGRRVVVTEGEAGERFRELLGPSVLEVEPVADFHTEAWRKLLGNLAGNSLTALTGGRAALVRSGRLRSLALSLLREGVAVGRAEGAALDDGDVERTLAFYDALPDDAGSSMLYDRLAGRPLEFDALTGALVRAARHHGIEVPLNGAMLALLEGLDASLRAEAP